MKIIVDYDSTIVKTHEAVLKAYREETGDYGTEINDENLTWNMKNICRYWSQEQVDNVFINPNLFKHMECFENAKDVLTMLHLEGHYLEICSMHKTAGIPLKYEWIKNNLPFIDKITILPLDNGLQKFDKSSVSGDIIIDDRIDSIETSPCKYKILYGKYSWNKDFDTLSIPNCLRVLDWASVYLAIKIIEKMEGHIL